MAPTPEQDDLDQFWRDLSAEMISDTITLEEAERRMVGAEEDRDELSESRILEIVQRATRDRPSTREPQLPPAPRGRLRRFRGWRQPWNAAATTTISALLMSAMLAVVLWPDSKYKSLRFDDATIVAVDQAESVKRRRTAIGFINGQIKSVISTLKETSAEGGHVGRVSQEVLLGLLMSLDSPSDLQMTYGSAPDLSVLAEGVSRKVDLSHAERAQLLRELGREAISGVSILWNVRGELQPLSAFFLKSCRSLIRR